MATPFRLKRSAVSNKRPALADLELGELAFNFYDGHLFAERDTGGVGIGTTVALLTPWIEDYGGGTLRYSGIVTATTYHGDQIVGTPTVGNFRAGAMASPAIDDKTKDQVEELNYILGKLVPGQPDTINGVDLNLDTNYLSSGNTKYPLCTGFTPVNNTPAATAPISGNTYYRNTDNKISTVYLTEYGPAESGTVTAKVNTTSVGSTSLKVSFGLYDAGSDNGIFNPAGISSTLGLQIANEKDASDSTRNVGIASLFYEVFDLRMLNVASPVGFNSCSFTHATFTTNSNANSFWYEDPCAVGAPDMTFSAVTPPPTSSDDLNYSSGVPHYTQSSNNAFTYVISVLNATGHMYNSTNNVLLSGEGATTGFTRPDQYKTFNEFVSAGGTTGTPPPVINFGVGAAVSTLATHLPQNIHATITSNHFHRWDCFTPYGNDQNERATLSESVNIMGTTADYTNNVDEDAIECTVGALTGGSATRVNAGAASDIGAGTSIFTAFNANATPAVYEAIVRGGDLRHDETNYSTGYLPAGGPNFSSGRSGTQYFQMKFVQSAISGFNISYTGSLAGCWVCMPNNADWMNGLSDYGGWANMFLAAPNSGAPRNAFPGCSSGGAMDNNGGTFTCTFGTQSSSNSTGDDVILVRFKLTSGNSISDISFSDT